MNRYWLIQQDVLREMIRMREVGLVPSAAQQAEYAAKRQAEAADRGPRNLSIAGDVAQINIEGVLTPKPDFWAWLFFGANTSYEEIQAAFALAKADPNVKRVQLNVASPGGTVEGLFETFAIMQDFGKPISARASLAASAAYGLVSQAGRIEATSPAAQFGSVGVVMSFFVDPQVIDVTSTEAPNKRPDVTTAEGQAVIREELDALHALFVDAIAAGRSKATGQTVTAKQVNSDYGRGSMFVAKDAKARGMIDGFPKLRAVRAEDERAPIADSTDAIPAPAEEKPRSGDQPTEGAAMAEPTKITTAAELRREYPNLVEEIEKSAVASERDRTMAHLTLGKQAGILDTAIEAVKTGEGMTLTRMAEYQSAAMNRRDQNTRQADSDRAGGTLEGATDPTHAAESEAGDIGDQIVARIEAGSGKVKKAS